MMTPLDDAKRPRTTKWSKQGAQEVDKKKAWETRMSFGIVGH